MFKLPFGNKPDLATQQLVQNVTNMQLQIEQLEAQLRSASHQKEKVDSALWAISDGIVGIDYLKRINLINKAALDSLGLDQSQVMGQPVDLVIKVYDKNTQLEFTHYCPVSNFSTFGLIFKKDSLRIVGKKEIFVDMICNQTEPTKFNNEPSCVFVFRDVTKDVELENMKLDFLSIAAHELRTPITSINGYMSVFLSENKAQLNQSQIDLLNPIVRATAELIDLVDSLLNITKIERGVSSLDFQMVDWNYLVTEQIKYFKQKAADKNLMLEYVTKPQTLPQVRIDKIRMTEVISNLLSNAIKYTDSGGKIKVWCEIKDNQIITHVADTGRGIEAKYLPNLFSKFYRAIGHLTKNIKGSGLGLYISKSILEMHHGRIWVNSELGKGSVFSFSIPF